MILINFKVWKFQKLRIHPFSILCMQRIATFWQHLLCEMCICAKSSPEVSVDHIDIKI